MYTVTLNHSQRGQYAALRELIRKAINDGADRFADLQDAELRCLVATAIRAAAPAQAWQFIAAAPDADRYPTLVADALERKYGGFLGLERTGERLVRALLAGAVSYAQDLIQQTFNEELAQQRVPAPGTVEAGGYRQLRGEPQ